MRYAVKVAYDGPQFHGSQRQGPSDIGSVEGRLVDGLKRIGQYDGEGTWPVEFSSRTDAGVSALSNVFAIETEMNISDLMKAVNSNVEGLYCIAAGAMRDQQNVRWANSRWYRYHLPPGELRPDQVEPFGNMLKAFVGSHDFRHFCKMEEGKDPEVLIERAVAMDVTGNGDMIVVDIVGSRFLWNQIRRMVGAALKVAKGELEADLVLELLKGKKASKGSIEIRSKIPTMPATGLVLMDVMFKDIEFIIDQDAARIAIDRNSKEAWKASMTVLLNSALRSLL